MDFQLVFGNPKKGKKKTKRKTKKKGSSKVAKKKKKKKVVRRKKAKKKAVRRKTKKKASSRKKKATKRKPVRRKKAKKKVTRRKAKKKTTRRKTKKRKNPIRVAGFKRKGKKSQKKTSKWVFTSAEQAKIKSFGSKIDGLKSSLASNRGLTPVEKRKATIAIKKSQADLNKIKSAMAGNLSLSDSNAAAYLKKAADRLASEGFLTKTESVTIDGLLASLGSSKKVKRSKKATRKTKKGGKKVAKRKKRRKSSKKRATTKASVRAGKRTTSARFKVKKRLGRKKTASKKVKRGRKSYRVSLKRLNPAIALSTQVPVVNKSLEEVLYLGSASAFAGTVDQLFAKIPMVGQYYLQAKGMLGSVPVLGASLGALAPSAALYGVEAAADKFAPGKYPSQLRKFNESLATVGMIQVVAGLAGLVAKQVPGLSGVMYSPALSGVSYTPMSGVSYTPMSGYNKHPQMGATPQMGHTAPQMGYGADFGRYDVSDYGGGSGYTENRHRSSADFGSADDEPVLDQSMGHMS